MYRSKRIVRRTVFVVGITLATAVPLLDPGSAAASPTPPGAGAAGEVSTSPTPYTVRSGDSLAGIAYRYGVGFSALLRANSMTVTSVIHPGDTITLPAGARTTPLTAATTSARAAATTSSAATSTTTPSTPAAADASSTTYVVKSGDALAGIAWKHGVKLGALVKANNLTVASVIYPGQTLTIPPATMAIPVQTAAPAAQTPAAQSPASTPGAATSAGAAAPAPNASIETVLTFLRAQVGVPYKFFSAGPDAYDCSGLVVAGWKQIGVNLPHQSQALSAKGTAVDWLTAPIQPGDLVFTSVHGDVARITHVGIALSDSTWIQAVGAGRTVTIGSMPSDTKILAVRRLA